MQLTDQKIQERIIVPTNDILFAFRRMDEIYQKLLMVLQDGIFVGLISAGDIQRAIIKNIVLTTPVKDVMRSNIRIADKKTGMAAIRQQMLEHRMEFMPVVDKNKRLVTVHFWEDVFGLQKEEEQVPLRAKVVIMAGGSGSRLKPLTNVIPKPLLPLDEKPIIEHIIDSFVKIGVSEFILSVNHKFELIKFFFDNIKKPDYKIEYIKEKKPYGTAGSLRLLNGKLHQTFIVSNCDILIDQDYREVWDYHKEQQNELTLISSLKSLNIPYGTIKVGENGQLLEMNEKPTLSYFINAGLYILEPHLLQEIPPDTFFNITDLIDKIRHRNGKIGVFPVSEGALLDIGSWKEYLKYLQK